MDNDDTPKNTQQAACAHRSHDCFMDIGTGQIASFPEVDLERQRVKHPQAKVVKFFCGDCGLHIKTETL